MSYDLGHSRSYINNITSGKSLPSMSEFFAICDYFKITPSEFFDQEQKNPELVNKALSKFQQLDEPDMLLVLSILNRLLNNLGSGNFFEQKSTERKSR